MEIHNNNDSVNIVLSSKEMCCIDLVVKIMTCCVQDHNEFRLLTFGTQTAAYSLLGRIYESVENDDRIIEITKEEFHIIKQSFNFLLEGSGALKKLPYLISDDDYAVAREIYNSLFGTT